MFPSIHLEEIPHDLTKALVERFHYTAKPFARQFNLGVWEAGRLIGAIVYGQGATPAYGAYFGCRREEIRELNRVALDRHESPTSRIVAVSLRLLRRWRPETKAVVSFADTEQNHIGTLYQASNFRYCGESFDTALIIHGERKHTRSTTSKFPSGSVAWLRENVDPETQRIKTLAKHRYAYFFDRELEAANVHRFRPFPKSAGSVNGSTSASSG